MLPKEVYAELLQKKTKVGTEAGMTQRMILRTGPNGMTAEVIDLRRSKPMSLATQRIPAGFTVGDCWRWSGIFDADGKLVAAFATEQELEMVLRDGPRMVAAMMEGRAA